MADAANLVARTRKLAELAAACEVFDVQTRPADLLQPGDVLMFSERAVKVEKRWESVTGWVAILVTDGDELFDLELHPGELVKVAER